MVASTYNEALRRLLVHEGGYTNHPSDPGGPTNFGITIFDYRKYVKPGATAEDVRTMKLDEAKKIYRAKYWDAQRDDELPIAVDYATFDYGVNSGIGRSGKVLRRVIGMPDNTSAVTPEVIAAVNKRDPKAVADAINDERLRFLQSLRTWPTFGPGWGRRVSEVKRYCDQLATGAVALPPTPPKTAEEAAKGGYKPPDPKKVTVPAAGATTGTGVWGLDWVLAHPFEAAAIAVAIGVAVYLVVRLLQKNHQAKQEAPTPGLQVVPELPNLVLKGGQR